MDNFAIPSHGSDLPAWFGKLPGMGDFAQRRMAAHFLQAWDDWLQSELSHIKIRHQDWLAHYLDAPLWFFAIGSNVLGVHPWIGVFMPSVDSVGRYFPLSLVNEIQLCGDGPPDAAARINSWWGRCANAALLALDADLNATSFEDLLNKIFENSSLIENKEILFPAATLPPEEGVSYWLAKEGLMFECRGLPMNAEFDALFGYPNVVNAKR
jgi:type VI secretion system protein ImpM